MNILQEVMLSDQSRIKGKARFTYSPLEKASEKKQNKTKQNKWRTRNKTNRNFKNFNSRGKWERYKINWWNISKRDHN